MAEVSLKKKVWGWMFFDWASQPYNTLLLTFIFGPYFAQTVSEMYIGDGMEAEAAKALTQGIWANMLWIAGLLIAFSAPVLGAAADASGQRLPWVWFFSILYVAGSFALWWAYPDGQNYMFVLVAFGIGFIGMEFATIFTNAMLPDLGDEKEIGKISGSGFAMGYWGGVIALFIMFLLIVDDAKTGKTLIGLDPLFGIFDAAEREGTRFVGPFTAIWYAVSMIFFFAWVKETPRHVGGFSIGGTFRSLGATLAALPKRSSLFAYLGSSLFYRDALNGVYTFGGIYATFVLEWELTLVGIFGILSAISAAFFSWVGGFADRRFGPKPVIVLCVLVLIGVCAVILNMTPDRIFGIALPEGSNLPTQIFFGCGAVIGAAGGVLQACSRSMMVRHSNPERPTEAFGLYALSGKSTAFLAPALIAAATQITGSARLGVSPLVGLFIISLILLIWVNPKGEVSKAS
jgi:UMF1 family MFS transporter